MEHNGKFPIKRFDNQLKETGMILVSDRVRRKEGGPEMVVTGYASGMVECRWYDGYQVRCEAFREDELCPLCTRQKQFAS